MNLFRETIVAEEVLLAHFDGESQTMSQFDLMDFLISSAQVHVDHKKMWILARFLT